MTATKFWRANIALKPLLISSAKTPWCARSKTHLKRVGDIREIIDSVHYRAASARYKIYIIDEVHMLSTSAFNALLKTLEEPPEHVKFIFATTEIRKVPVTVLSRCQRFDLRRIEPEVMISHLQNIAGQENASVADDALALITRAAEGSVRDALSLLDQAISHGAGETTAEQVRAMLGLADRGRVLDLFELIMQGDAATALEEVSGQYANGADPLAILRDLAEITHWISVIKITPNAVDDPTINPDERDRGAGLAERLPMRAMTRMWQMLLKAIEEVSAAPPISAATSNKWWWRCACWQWRRARNIKHHHSARTHFAWPDHDRPRTRSGARGCARAVWQV